MYEPMSYLFLLDSEIRESVETYGPFQTASITNMDVRDVVEIALDETVRWILEELE